MDVSWLYLLALGGAMLGVGVIAGVMAGLLGIGGGIVIVPALFHVFSELGIDEAVKMHLAVGTSLATIIPTSISSLRAHHRKGSVDWQLFRSWAPGIAVGVLIGTLIATGVNGPVLSAIFAVVALAVAFNLAFGRDTWRIANAPPAGLGRWPLSSVIGGVSAMMGIGGGTLSVPTLVLCNYPVRRAVGTAAAIGLLIGVPGTIGFVVSGLGVDGRPVASIGYVSLIGFAVLVPATVVAAPWGAQIAHAIPAKLLKRIFAAFLTVTAGRMLYGLIGA